MAEGRPTTQGMGGFVRFTECSVCLGKITDPRSLPCRGLHSFCADCLRPLVQNQAISCPQCRQQCPLPAGGVDDLPRNPLLVEVLGKVCEECQDRNKEVECSHCGKTLCKLCHELCKLNAELFEKIQQKSQNLDEVKQQRNQRELRKDEAVKEFSDNVQTLVNIILNVQDRITTDYRQTFVEATSLLDVTCGEISKEVQKLQQHIDNNHNCDRVGLTESNILTRRAECMKSVQSLAPHRPIPPDTAVYLPDINVLDEITRAVEAMSTSVKQVSRSALFQNIAGDSNQAQTEPQPIIYSSPHIRHEKFTNSGSVLEYSIRPSGVAVSPLSGNIAVLEQGDHTVCIYDRRYSYVRKFGCKGRAKRNLLYPSGVVFNSKGDLVITDSGNHRIQTFSEVGDFISVFGSHGQGPGQFDWPEGLALYGEKLYVTERDNERIQILTESGNVIRTFAVRDKVRSWKPLDVAVQQNGDIVVSVTSTASSKILLFSQDGRAKGSICSGDQGSVKLINPRGITVDEADNIIVTDAGTNQIHFLTPTGQLIRSLGGTAASDIKLIRPRGVACIDHGQVLVTDGSSRVQVLKFKSPKS